MILGVDWASRKFQKYSCILKILSSLKTGCIQCCDTSSKATLIIGVHHIANKPINCFHLTFVINTVL